MGTRTELHDEGEPTSVVEPDVGEAAGEAWLGADDIFIAARSNLRERLPVSMRQGRHGVKSGRKVRGRSRHGAQATQRMYLVDGDGEAETTRIAQRLSFEDISDTDATSETQESAAG